MVIKGEINACKPWYCIYIYIYIVRFNEKNLNIEKSKKAMYFRRM